MYQYLSGYTAKVAGTELGVTEPKATFSTCYGAAFLAVHPTVYASILGKKMQEHHAEAYLVNTGWTSGVYGVGHRMGLVETRHVIDAILDGTLSRAEYEDMPVFGFHVPKMVHDVDSHILNPRETWHDRSAYDATARKLAQMFIDNFKRFENTAEGARLAQVAGPRL
jgi:phosphoenolpyruvate carboxykinase (ATP)